MTQLMAVAVVCVAIQMLPGQLAVIFALMLAIVVGSQFVGRRL